MKSAAATKDSELRAGYALVIGIDSYGRGISPLKSAVADAGAIGDLLASAHDYTVERLLDMDACRENIEDNLEKLAGTLKEEAAFLLYFAGHGVAQGDGTGDPQGFLLPQDARPADIDSWLSMEWLRDSLNKLPCQHLLVVLDCCFAGSFRWASTRDILSGGKPLYDSQFRRYLRGSAWQALTSASADEKAMDVCTGARNTRDGIVDEDHSPFAAALLRGLSGAADSSRGGHEPDGVLTATELFQYAFEELVPADKPTQQTPGIWPLKPDNQGQYIFRNPSQPRKLVPDPPLDEVNNPWLGLSAYTSLQQRLFFGRQRVVKELRERVETGQGLLAVLGASGTGKSSVVKAGLIPQLMHTAGEESAWCIVEMERLGSEPCRRLQTAVAALDKSGTESRRLLLIDQFEELYTHSSDTAQRHEFLKGLRALIEDDITTVVVTLRSDFEPRPLASPELRDAWERDGARYVVPAFTIEEYRNCIEGPAHERAVYFEPVSLVDDLLDEVASNPGALPMLSFALAEMYRRARDRRLISGTNDRALTQDDYASIDGIVGAMHRRATILWEESDEAQRASIERVFLRMLSSDGGRLAKRRVTRRELIWADPQERQRVDHVLQQYINARLLVADQDRIEPAHDSLIAAWDLLLEWRQDAKPQSLLRAIWQDAYAWLKSEQDPGVLWDNDPERMTLAESRMPELNQLETEFIRASRKSFRRKRFRRWLTGTGGFAVIAGLMYILALNFSDLLDEADERGDAETARDRLYLEFNSREPRVYSVNSVLGSPTGNALESVEPNEWAVLIGDRGNSFAMAITLPPLRLETGEPYMIGEDAHERGWGRIVAVGDKKLLENIGTTTAASRFLEHSLSWLETDPLSPIYISVGHEEQLTGLPQEELPPLAEIPENMAGCFYDDKNIRDEEEVAGFLGKRGIRPSLAPDDRMFAGSDLHTRLWDLGYCEIYAVWDLTLLDSDDVSQGVLIIGDAWHLEPEEQRSIQKWVIEDDNGLLITGSGLGWLNKKGGDLSRYPMNQAMSVFNMQWSDRMTRLDD